MSEGVIVEENPNIFQNIEAFMKEVFIAND